ncbi:hypothetical protein [Microbacterium sp. CPCC 204701]|uniref:hypothetical protein n=1 Tax=Microbacterium sp. CPCC 204701 TaxID=2493084 RepID=UPI000FDB85F2|nr:hypothetical protein [Microbacterium sp. CPCC 204701]
MVRDVSVDLHVLQESGRAVLDAATSLSATGEPGPVSEAAVGSAEVAAVLAQVSLEQATRAETAATTLGVAGRKPGGAAHAVDALDRGIVGAV